MLLSRLLSDVEVLSPFFDREIADITDSTEKIRKNSAFVCVKGMHKDGHSFASEAVSSGAAAIIAEHDVNSPLQVQYFTDRLPGPKTKQTAKQAFRL